MSNISQSPVKVENIPQAMKDRKQWCLWELAERHGKKTKIPLQGNLTRARSNDRSTWGEWAYIYSRYERLWKHGKGLGYFLADGEVGIDIDKCITDGDTTPEAVEIVERLDSYSEISPSGTGIRIFALGSVPGKDKRSGRYEIYDKTSPRFMTVTGNKIGSTYTVEPRQDAIHWFHTQYVKRETTETTPEPEPTAAVPENEVLRVALQDHSIRRLWEGIIDGYDSHSEADAALCSLLAYYTGPNPEKIDSLFRQSGLMRDKWDENRGSQTYGGTTIQNMMHRDKYYSWVSADDVVGSFDSEPEQKTETHTDDVKSKNGRFRNWSNVMNTANTQVEDWLLPNWLEFGSLGMLCGNPFEGKSTIVCELTAAIKKWGTFGPYAVSDCPILLIDLENKERITVERLKRATEGDTTGLERGWSWVEFTEAYLPLDPKKVESVTQQFRAFNGNQKCLVIIDTLRSAFAEDEMEGGDMKKLLYPLQRVALRQHAAILILHHRPKSGAKFSGQTHIAGCVDYLWTWEIDRETRIGTLDLYGTRGDLQDPIRFRYDVDVKRNLWIQEKTIDQVEGLVLSALDAGSLSQTELVKRVRNGWSGSAPGINKVRAMIDDLVGSVIIKARDAHGWQYGLLGA